MWLALSFCSWKCFLDKTTFCLMQSWNFALFEFILSKCGIVIEKMLLNKFPPNRLWKKNVSSFLLFIVVLNGKLSGLWWRMDGEVFCWYFFFIFFWGLINSIPISVYSSIICGKFHIKNWWLLSMDVLFISKLTARRMKSAFTQSLSRPYLFNNPNSELTKLELNQKK